VSRNLHVDHTLSNCNRKRVKMVRVWEANSKGVRMDLSSFHSLFLLRSGKKW